VLEPGAGGENGSFVTGAAALGEGAGAVWVGAEAGGGVAGAAAELLPAPANGHQRLASGWGESVRPPPMRGGASSPDAGGTDRGHRWRG